MINASKTTLTAALALALTASAAAAADTSKLTNERERLSYSIGIAFGRSLIQQGMGELDFEKVLQGMRDSYERRELAMSEEEYRATYRGWQQHMTQRMGKTRQLAGLDNKMAGDAFMAENGKKEGVVTLESGLQYKILSAGTGEKPTATDTVTANYRGSLLDGTEIDNTWKRNQPATFDLKGAIPGWREAMQMMPVGSKWELYVPPQLAYSAQGAGALIGPNMTLIFEVELLSIKKPE